MKSQQQFFIKKKKRLKRGSFDITIALWKTMYQTNQPNKRSAGKDMDTLPGIWSQPAVLEWLCQICFSVSV